MRYLIFAILFCSCATRSSHALKHSQGSSPVLNEKIEDDNRDAKSSRLEDKDYHKEELVFISGSVGSQILEYLNGDKDQVRRFTLSELKFPPGSAAIKEDSRLVVDEVAAILKAFPDIDLVVEGYSDISGSAEANKQLTQARANAVKARLMANGILAERIESYGYGGLNPISDNTTAEGRAANRRIEVIIK